MKYLISAGALQPARAAAAGGAGHIQAGGQLGTLCRPGMPSGWHRMWCSGRPFWGSSPLGTSCTRTPVWTPGCTEGAQSVLHACNRPCDFIARHCCRSSLLFIGARLAHHALIGHPRSHIILCTTQPQHTQIQSRTTIHAHSLQAIITQLAGTKDIQAHTLSSNPSRPPCPTARNRRSPWCCRTRSSMHADQAAAACLAACA